MNAPLILVELACYKILVLVGIDPEIAYYAQIFSLFFFVATSLHMQFDCYRQYLNSTGQSRIVQYAVSSTLLLHLVFNFLFTKVLKFGICGIGISIILTLGLNLLFVMLHSWKMNVNKIEPIPKNKR